MALKLIGAGLGRTGTASVKVALEKLGLGTCYHMTEVMKNPDNSRLWMDAAQGKPDWERIFDGYTATVDYPGCTFWRELADYYPEAKVLLTVRDPEKWFESTYDTILSSRFTSFTEHSPWGEMMRETVWNTLDNRMDEREFMVSYFKRRNEQIIDAIPADRLLVYEVKEGWEPLCRFLGVDVPDSEFPRINSRGETQQLISNLISSSGGELSDGAMKAAGRELHGDDEINAESIPR